MKPDFKFENTQGVEYKVFLRKPRKCEGICYNPMEQEPKIYINPRGSKGLLNTCIHEFCHAFFWDKTEAQVYKFANTLSKFLYQQGWRRDIALAPIKQKTTRRKSK